MLTVLATAVIAIGCSLTTIVLIATVVRFIASTNPLTAIILSPILTARSIQLKMCRQRAQIDCQRHPSDVQFHLRLSAICKRQGDIHNALISSTRAIHAMLFPFEREKDSIDLQTLEAHMHSTLSLLNGHPGEDQAGTEHSLIAFMEKLMLKISPLESGGHASRWNDIIMGIPTLYELVGAKWASIEIASLIRKNLNLDVEHSTELACFMSRAFFRRGQLIQSKTCLDEIDISNVETASRVSMERAYQLIFLGDFSAARIILERHTVASKAICATKEHDVMWHRLLSYALQGQGDILGARTHLRTARILSRHNEAVECCLRFELSRQALLGFGSPANEKTETSEGVVASLGHHFMHWFSSSVGNVPVDLAKDVVVRMDQAPAMVFPRMSQTSQPFSTRYISAYFDYLCASRYARWLGHAQTISWREMIYKTSFLYMEADTIAPLASIDPEIQPEWLSSFLQARDARKKSLIQEACNKSISSFEMLTSMASDADILGYTDLLADKIYEVSREAILVLMRQGTATDVHLAMAVHDCALSWRHDMRMLSPDELRDPLGSDQTLIRIALCERESFVWFTGRGECVWKKLPDRGTLKSVALALLDSCAGRKTRDLSSSDECRLFGSILFDGLEIDLSGDIFIIADPDLADIPWAALLVGSGGERLVSRSSITIIPSACSVIASKHRSFQSNSTNRCVVFSQPAIGDSGLATLSFSKIEADTICTVMGDRQVDYLTGHSDIDLLKCYLQEASIIHFSSHGVLTENGERAIFLAKYSEMPINLLTPSDIMHMSINADLVVLNLCDSASRNGYFDDAFGNLPRAFIAAGAMYVITTLWPVEDLPSSLLMVRFYRELQDGDSTNYAEALRRAQNTMSKEAPWSSPQYWGAYQLQGIPLGIRSALSLDN